jgi:hypothetical protein
VSDDTGSPEHHVRGRKWCSCVAARARSQPRARLMPSPSPQLGPTVGHVHPVLTYLLTYLLALRGQRPLGGEPGGVGERRRGGRRRRRRRPYAYGIGGGGKDDNISTTPLWAAPCAPALSRSETELGANGAEPGAPRAGRQHVRRA